MNNILEKTLIYSIFILLLLAWWAALSVGLSTDEYFHHLNGLKRYNFLISLGKDEDFQFRNNEFYPGLYDTLSYAFGQVILFINKSFYAKNIDIVMHIVNITFSSLSILGLYLFTKKFFNKNIAILTSFLTLSNPFFFGHMGMNSKDLIVFFSLIWFCYFFYLYCTEDKKIFRNLLLTSVFIGFGCGVRLTFLVVILPVILCGLVFLFNKYKSKTFDLLKRLFFHFFIVLIIVSFLVIICWPHMMVEIRNGNFLEFFILIVQNTLNWIDGPKTGIINGEYYEVFNTPKSYFLKILIYRLPFYFSILVFLSYFFILKKESLLKTDINYFNTKFYIINFIAFFPIFLALILSVNIYDNLRLFLFIIPFFSIIASFTLYEMINTFKKSWKIKICLCSILILFSLSFYRFVLLTPYQYDYINYSSLKLSNAQNKWEHDYWGSSYKELVLNIKKKYTKEQIANFKITNCSGDDTLLYYLYRYLGKKFIYRAKREYEATHVVLINRATLDITNPAIKDLVNEKGHMLVKDMEKVVRTPGVKVTCNESYPGEDVVTVTRNGLKISSFRKLK